MHHLETDHKKSGQSSFAVMFGFFVVVCLIVLVFIRLGAPMMSW